MFNSLDMVYSEYTRIEGPVSTAHTGTQLTLLLSLHTRRRAAGQLSRLAATTSWYVERPALDFWLGSGSRILDRIKIRIQPFAILQIRIEALGSWWQALPTLHLHGLQRGFCSWNRCRSLTITPQSICRFPFVLLQRSRREVVAHVGKIRPVFVLQYQVSATSHPTRRFGWS